RLDLNRVISARALATRRNRVVESRVRPLVDDLLGSARAGLLTLLAAVAVLLLVACANVAGLMLVRSSGRAHEFAVRVALGATRASLARQLLAEAFVLTLVSSILAIITAHSVLPVFVAILPADVPRLAEAALDRRALLFTALLAIAATCASSSGPAIRIARGGVEPALRRSTPAMVEGGLR